MFASELIFCKLSKRKNPINCFKEDEGDANIGLAYEKKNKKNPSLQQSIQKYKEKTVFLSLMLFKCLLKKYFCFYVFYYFIFMFCIVIVSYKLSGGWKSLVLARNAVDVSLLIGAFQHLITYRIMSLARYMLTGGLGRNAKLLLSTLARHASVSSLYLTKNTFLSLVLLSLGFWRGDGIDSLPNISPL